MQIEKSELARKIDKLKSVVPKSSNIAALQGICVCGDKMIAGNGEMTVKAKIGAEHIPRNPEEVPEPH